MKNLALICALLTLTAGPMAIASAAEPDFTGVWQATRGSAALLPAAGSLPLLPDAKAAYQATQTATLRGDRAWDSADQCIPPGTPRTQTQARPFEILQEPTQLTMLFELQRLYRTVALNGYSHASSDPTFMGTSMGHWEGSQLVIVTSNFKTGTFLNDAGVPHSDQLQVTERWTLTDHNTLTDELQIQDAATFSAAWNTRLVFKRRHVRIAEDVCVDREQQPSK